MKTNRELKQMMIDEAKLQANKYMAMYHSAMDSGYTDKANGYHQTSKEWMNAAYMLEDEIRQQAVTDFKVHLDDMLKLREVNEDAFLNMDWEISFGGKSLKQYNCAMVYNAVYGLCEELLEDM